MATCLLALSAIRAAPAPAALPDACAVAGGQQLSFVAADGSSRRSTLSISEDRAGLHLQGMTQLEDGSCFSEEASLDAEGRLMRAESTHATERVVFDASRGTVEVTALGGARSWSVATDLPWIWAPRLDARTLATPLAAIVTWRAARTSQAVRLIDLDAADSHTIMADQLLVPECKRVDLVVIGDEAVTMQRGMPERWYASTFRRQRQAKWISARTD